MVLSEEKSAQKLVEQAREKAVAETSEAGKSAAAIIHEAGNKAGKIILEAKRISEEEAEVEYKAVIDLALSEAEKSKIKKIPSLISAAEEAFNFLITPIGNLEG